MTNKTATSGVLAALAALSLAACTGSGGGGTTTIIQQPPAANSAPTTSTTSKVTPISDGKELCHQARGKTSELTNALQTFWKLLHRDGWTWSDPDISAAADKVKQAKEKILPQIEGVIGPNAPQEVADAVRSYASAAKELSQSIDENATNEELVPFGKKFGDAYDALTAACKL